MVKMGGNPRVSLSLWNIYVLPRLIYERGSDKRVLRAFKQFLCNQNFKHV